jgi:hypothetical protein
MMDVGDLDGDARPEIVVGLGAGLVNALDGQGRKLWSSAVPSPPTVVRIVPSSGAAWLCVGTEDGSVIAMDKQGRVARRSVVTGRPVDLQVMSTPGGPLAVLLTETGEVSGFRLD